MKMKKIAAALMALALVGVNVPFTGAFTEYSLASHAADSENISDSVLPSLPIVSQINTSVYKGEKHQHSKWVDGYTIRALFSIRQQLKQLK